MTCICPDIKAGDRIRYQRKKGFGFSAPVEYGEERDGFVRIHWHYDGCVLDIEEVRYAFLVDAPSVHPEFDRVERV